MDSERIKITPAEGWTCISIGPTRENEGFRRAFSAIFVAIGFAFVYSVAGMVRKDQSGDLGAVIFIAVVCIAMAATYVSILTIILWSSYGIEEFALSASELKITYRLLGASYVRTFPLTEIRRMRFEEVFYRRKGTGEYSVWHIAFDCRGKRVATARSLSVREGMALMRGPFEELVSRSNASS